MGHNQSKLFNGVARGRELWEPLPESCKARVPNTVLPLYATVEVELPPLSLKIPIYDYPDHIYNIK